MSNSNEVENSTVKQSNYEYQIIGDLWFCLARK